MPKKLIYAGAPAFASFSAGGKFFGGLFWGAGSGAVIGTGISLSIGLFYNSSEGMVYAVIFVSSLLGGLFGRVMEHLLSDAEVSFLGRAAGGGHHRITEHMPHNVDLTDYRTLKAMNGKNNIPAQDIQDIIHSVRTTSESSTLRSA